MADQESRSPPPAEAEFQDPSRAAASNFSTIRATRAQGDHDYPAAGSFDSSEAVAQRWREQVVSGFLGLGNVAVAAPAGWTPPAAVAASSPGARLRWSPGWPMVAGSRAATT